MAMPAGTGRAPRGAMERAAPGSGPLTTRPSSSSSYGVASAYGVPTAYGERGVRASASMSALPAVRPVTPTTLAALSSGVLSSGQLVTDSQRALRLQRGQPSTIELQLESLQAHAPRQRPSARVPSARGTARATEPLLPPPPPKIVNRMVHSGAGQAVWSSPSAA